MAREILTDWVTPAGAGFRSVMYFSEVPAVADQREDLATLFGTIDALMDAQVSWTIETSGREMDDATGTLTDVWSETTLRSGTGAVAGQAVPDASQLLLRWNTAHIINGRILKGRTFLPGLSSSSVLDGNVLAASVATCQAAVDAFIAAVTGFGVWHRPVSSSGGEFNLATSGSVWSDWAVLRRRRQ